MNLYCETYNAGLVLGQRRIKRALIHIYFQVVSCRFVLYDVIFLYLYFRNNSLCIDRYVTIHHVNKCSISV